jgi:glucosamine kinase
MILIADSGSTKTDWVLVDEEDKSTFCTIGYNPFFIKSDAICQSLSESLVPHIDANRVNTVYFYGAGCSIPENNAILESALSKCFRKADIYVSHDLLAAARALLGANPGFAAILGTGSNTCLYNGEVVTHNIDSLGFLLGDEGSGSCIGRKLLRDFLRNAMPADLKREFQKTWNLSYDYVFERLYRGDLPNRFLAGFCEFADHHKKESYIIELVRESFQEFFRHLVSHYPNYSNYDFNCIGSVGFIFSSVLKEVASEFGMQTGMIIKAPIDNLVRFHLANNIGTNEKEISNSSGGR